MKNHYHNLSTDKIEEKCLNKRRLNKTSGVIWAVSILFLAHCQTPSAMIETLSEGNVGKVSQNVPQNNTQPPSTLPAPSPVPDSPLSKYMLAYRQSAQKSAQAQLQAIPAATTGGFIGIGAGGASAPAPFAMGPAPSSPEGASSTDADLPASPQGSPTFTQTPQFKAIVALYKTLLTTSLFTVAQLGNLEVPPEIKADHDIILRTEKLQIQYLKQVIPLLEAISQGSSPEPEAIQNLQTSMIDFPGLLREKQKAQGRLALLFYTEEFETARSALSLSTAPLTEEEYIQALPAEDFLMDSPAFLKWVDVKIPGLSEPEYPQAGSSELINLRAKYASEKETLLRLNPPKAWKNYHIWRFVTAQLTLDTLDALDAYLAGPGDSPDFLNYVLSQPDLLLLSTEQAALKEAYASPKPTGQ